MASQSWKLKPLPPTAWVGCVPRTHLGTYRSEPLGKSQLQFKYLLDLEVWLSEEALAWHEYGLGLNASR